MVVEAKKSLHHSEMSWPFPRYGMGRFVEKLVIFFEQVMLGKGTKPKETNTSYRYLAKRDKTIKQEHSSSSVMFHFVFTLSIDLFTT